MKSKLALLAMCLVLTGCGASTDDKEKMPPGKQETGGNVRAVEVKLIDGRTVPCVIWQSVQEGGISCDWDSAR